MKYSTPEITFVELSLIDVIETSNGEQESGGKDDHTPEMPIGI